MTMPSMCFAEGAKFKLHCNDFLKVLIMECAIKLILIFLDHKILFSVLFPA